MLQSTFPAVFKGLWAEALNNDLEDLWPIYERTEIYNISQL